MLSEPDKRVRALSLLQQLAAKNKAWLQESEAFDAALATASRNSSVGVDLLNNEIQRLGLAAFHLNPFAPDPGPRVPPAVPSSTPPSSASQSEQRIPDVK